MKVTKFLFTLFLSAGVLFQVNAQESVYGKDSSECAKNLSVFHSYAKQKNYSDAMKSWRYCYYNCPKVSKWVFIDGAKILMDKINNSKSDKEVYNAYVDTLMQMYDKRIECFGEEGTVVLYKATYLYKYKNNDLEELEKVKVYFESAIEKLGQNLPSFAPVYYFKTMERLVKYEKVEASYLIDRYFEMSELMDANIAKNDKNKDSWVETQTSVEKIMEPFLSCDQLLPIYDKKLGENPDKEALGKMVMMMEKKGCTESPTYEKAAGMLCDIEPSSICKAALGRMMYRKEKYAEAKALIDEAIALETEASKKSEYYVLLADIHKKTGATSSALSACNNAIAQNPNNGSAYLIKAGIYSSLAKSCAKAFDQKAAYCAVVDLYEQAAAVDPSIADKARSGAAKYSAYFPTKGEIFFETLNVGDSYTVPCLGVSTKLRAKVE